MCSIAFSACEQRSVILYKAHQKTMCKLDIHVHTHACPYTDSFSHMSTGSGRAGVECGDQASPERGVLPGGQGG